MNESTPDKRYTIRSAETRGFWTGKAGGRYVLIGLTFPYITAIFFDNEGKYIQYSQRELPARIRQDRRWRFSIRIRTEIDELIDEWKKELDFSEGPIQVQSFYLSDLNIGVQQYPEPFLNVLANPSKFPVDHYEAIVRHMEEWKQANQFVLYWNNDYWLDSEGRVVAS